MTMTAEEAAAIALAIAAIEGEDARISEAAAGDPKGRPLRYQRILLDAARGSWTDAARREALMVDAAD